MNRIADAYLAHHLAFRPVDASFMGLDGHDDRLPDASAGAADAERRGIAALRALIAGEPAVDTVGDRLDRRLASAQLAVTEAALDHAPRFANPAWYTGEAAFAIISLLLPQVRAVPPNAIVARLRGLPDFLADGRARLAGGAAPKGLVQRAIREAEAMALFLEEDVRLHPDWDEAWSAPATAAARAFHGFVAAIVGLPDAPAACGRDLLAILMREGHGLDVTPEQALAAAERRFADDGEALAELAARIDPARSVDEIVGGLAEHHAGDAEGVLARYRALDDAARGAAPALVTVADGYGLEYRWMPPCFRRVAPVLYFLFYRSPPAAAPGDGSI